LKASKKRLVDDSAPSTSTEVKKKKKNFEIPAEPLVEVVEKKKSKKRKLDESMEEEKPKSKKLNILTMVEDPQQFRNQRETLKAALEAASAPLLSKKLKTVLPKASELVKKQKKKKAQKVIPEPKTSLPRPVWTSSGVFIEEPMTPFKFRSTQYKPLEHVAVAFEAKKKKKQQVVQQLDFKTQKLMEKKNRDGSKKNMMSLLGKVKV
jgi:hypothetical protein